MLERPLCLLVLLCAIFLPFSADAQNSCSSCYQRNRPLCETGCEGAATRLAFSNCAKRCVDQKCVQFCGQGAVSGGDDAPAAAGPTPPQASGNTYPNAGGPGGFAGDEQEEIDSTSCGECMRAKQTGECMSDCSGSNSADLQACVNRCAKARCASHCRLPGKLVKDKPPASARDCAECKRTSETRCHNRCGYQSDYGSDRPGYTTCMVSCAEETCMEICSPSSYE